MFLHRKLNDQYRILTQQTDQHDHRYLCIDVIF